MPPDNDTTPASLREKASQLLQFRPRETAALAVLAAVVVAGAVFAFVRALPRAVAEAAPTSQSTVLAEASPSVLAGKLIVHVAGAVGSPGVYELPPGSRVGDAINAAGGPKSDADANTLNLARPLNDGERVYVSRRGEVAAQQQAGGASGGGSAGGPTAEGKVNINTASAKELEDLPGIGPALAQRIIDYRTQHGPFRQVRDLMKVAGIGERKFEALKEQVAV